MDLGGIPLGDLSAPAILGLFVVLVLFGGIPTRRELKDSQAREAKWQEIAERWQQVATEHGMTLNRILDYAETSNHAITEIQSVLIRPAGEKATT